MINGKLQKLKIMSWKSNAYKDSEKLDTYEVLFNPEQLEDNVKVGYEGAKPGGGSDTDQKYKGTDPKQFRLTLLFDGTGIYGSGDDVMTQIEKLKKVVVDMKSDTHKPRALKISWGYFLFKGVLTSLKITYSLFRPDGSPLRAKGEAEFISTVSDNERVKRENKSSPDLTHVREVKAGDTLPLLTRDIYGTESYYLEIARFNKLKNFRSLIPGSKIYFPPLDKAS